MNHHFAHLSNLLAAMPQAVFVKDAHSRIVMMSAACEALWGVRFEEVAGTDCEETLALQAMRERLGVLGCALHVAPGGLRISVIP